jgi:hypothetical protein
MTWLEIIMLPFALVGFSLCVHLAALIIFGWYNND